MLTYAATLTEILEREPLPADGIPGREIEYQVGDVVPPAWGGVQGADGGAGAGAG